MILYTLNKEEKVAEYKKYLKICQELLGEDGDWENKNKLIVYEGILMMIERNFKKGAELFLGCVNTFNAPEIITFDQLNKILRINKHLRLFNLHLIFSITLISSFSFSFLSLFFHFSFSFYPVFIIFLFS